MKKIPRKWTDSGLVGDFCVIYAERELHHMSPIYSHSSVQQMCVHVQRSALQLRPTACDAIRRTLSCSPALTWLGRQFINVGRDAGAAVTFSEARGATVDDTQVVQVDSLRRPAARRCAAELAASMTCICTARRRKGGEGSSKSAIAAP